MFGESRQDGYKKHHFLLLTANKSQLKWLPDILIHLCQVKINQRTLNVQETIFFKSHQINSSYTALIKKMQHKIHKNDLNFAFVVYLYIVLILLFPEEPEVCSVKNGRNINTNTKHKNVTRTGREA